MRSATGRGWATITAWEPGTSTVWALRAAVGGRRFTTDVERVIFALVANRAIDPASKLAAAEWATCDVVMPGLAGMDEDQAYRAMDVLVAGDAEAKVRQAVVFSVAHPL